MRTARMPHRTGPRSHVSGGLTAASAGRTAHLESSRSGVTCGLVVGLVLALALAGCARTPEEEVDGAPRTSVDLTATPDAVPRLEPLSRYGNPPSYEVYGKRYRVMSTSRGYVERGIASWYGTKFHGRRTSSGETYDMYAMTAAHKSLPLPTYVAVTNLRTGRRVVVKVNDRGPFHDNRVVDLSYAAAVKLGIAEKGTGLVEVQAIDPTGAPPRPVVPVARGEATIYLQAGAFSVRDNAERLAARLGTVAEPGVRITDTSTEGRTLYRVRLGPLASVDEADRLTDLVRALGFEPPRVVIE